MAHKTELGRQMIATLHFATALDAAHNAGWALWQETGDEGALVTRYELMQIEKARVDFIDAHLVAALMTNPPVTGEDRIDLIHTAQGILADHPDEYRTWLAERCLD